MRVTIIGSSRFAKEMVDYKKRLADLGHEVNLHEHYHALAKGDMKDVQARMGVEHAQVKIENNYHKYHYDEIVNRSDAVLVLNFDKNGILNYVGGNTLMEMGMAYVHDKKVFLLNPVPEMAYAEEIKSLEPIILMDDLSLIA
ncbi:MAG: hypothetical protein JWO73_867 [Candidatus Taylorbacteria bacterium]|nr:hypothetical protein [Candidatus Taylorbacteria bacterium]